MHEVLVPADEDAELDHGELFWWCVAAHDTHGSLTRRGLYVKRGV